ncbi:hypothetical protein CR513_57924, partial [Mucuna pruriens]
MQGFLTIQTVSLNEKFVFIGNRVKALVEATKTYHLILNTCILKHNHLVGIDSLNTEILLTLHHNVGTKHSLANERFSLLWYRWLENKQNTQRNGLQEALNFLKFCILIYVDLLMLILSKRKDTLLPLLMTIHVMVMPTYCMRNVNYLEIYLNEVKRQLNKKVKVVKSDKGGEYCKRYDETGKHQGPFAKLL